MAAAEEQQAWKEALEDYMFENPSDWIAKWLYGKFTVGMWEGTAYEDIMRDWYAGLSSRQRRLYKSWQERPEEGRRYWDWPFNVTKIAPTPAWMSEKGYEIAPGETKELRPLSAQANLTTEQLDQLMYYMAYTKAGKPESEKEYLQTIAYKMPGWVQDYMSTTQGLWPTKAAPKAQYGAAWQR